MIDLKPWYLSKTVWASLATVILSVLAAIGLPIDGLDGSRLADHIIELLTGLAGLVALWGRLTASSRIR